MPKVAFARKEGHEDWEEILLTEVQDRIPAATAWAQANGYIVRIAEIDLDARPDFANPNLINL